ncbi:hypothetical protein BsWGS_23967 [Bradybaena similaris]
MPCSRPCDSNVDTSSLWAVQLFPGDETCKPQKGIHQINGARLLLLPDIQTGGWRQPLVGEGGGGNHRFSVGRGRATTGSGKPTCMQLFGDTGCPRGKKGKQTLSEVPATP